MKKLPVKKIIFLLFFSVITLALISAATLQIPVQAEWKYQDGDNEFWADPDMSDSMWKTIELPAAVKMEGNGMFWLRSELTIPPEFKGKKVYFETGRSSCAMDIYVNGILIGQHGCIEPKLNISYEGNSILLIPEKEIHNNKIKIALRCKCGSSHGTFNQFYWSDINRRYLVETVQRFLNITAYYMFAAICLFLGVYFLFRFFSDPTNRAGLYFAFTLITISFYFFDIASELLILPIYLQRSLARLSFIFSMGFLVLFMGEYFHCQTKLLKIIVYSILAIMSVAYAVCMRNDVIHEILFTLSLIPVFAAVVFVFVFDIKAVIRKQPNSKFILGGLLFALTFATHDIIYQAMMAVPFAWLQGFSFFIIDLTMFIVVSVESAQNKRKLKVIMDETSSQRDRLNTIVSNAEKLSLETITIAKTLEDSVSNVAQSAARSACEAQRIGGLIAKQNDAVKNTSEAVGSLVESLERVNTELQSENTTIENTAQETNLMVTGVGQVADGIDSAVNFAKSLDNMTYTSSNDVSVLVGNMEDIKNFSTEILGVVQVVTDFAEQTNMLAMNASIEAAHAGTSGQGFSVIAHEIKNLAAASRNQADKIKTIVTEINKSISEGFNLSVRVRDTLKQVSTGAASTNQSVSESAQSMERQKQAGERIVKATQEMTNSAAKVKQEAENQFSYSQQVSSNITKLAETAEEANKAVSDILDHNVKLCSQMNELSSLATRAKEAAQGLNRLISD